MADCVHSLRRHTPRFPAHSMTASSSFRPTPCPCACGATANARISASVSSCASSLAGPNGSSVIVPRMPLPASLTATSTTQPSAKPNPRSVSAYPLPSGSSPSARYAATRNSPTATYSSGRGSRIITGAGYPQVAGSAPGVRCRPEQCRRTGAADRAHHRSARGHSGSTEYVARPSWSGGSPAGALPVRQDLTTPEGSPFPDELESPGLLGRRPASPRPPRLRHGGPDDRRGNGLPGDHPRSSNGGDHQIGGRPRGYGLRRRRLRSRGRRCGLRSCGLPGATSRCSRRAVTNSSM